MKTSSRAHQVTGLGGSKLLNITASNRSTLIMEFAKARALQHKSGSQAARFLRPVGIPTQKYFLSIWQIFLPRFSQNRQTFPMVCLGPVNDHLEAY